MLSRFLEGLGLKRSEGAEKEELRELSPAAQYEKEELGRYLERIESANPQSYLQFVERVKTFKVNLWPYEVSISA